MGTIFKKKTIGAINETVDTLGSKLDVIVL